MPSAFFRLHPFERALQGKHLLAHPLKTINGFRKTTRFSPLLCHNAGTVSLPRSICRHAGVPDQNGWGRSFRPPWQAAVMSRIDQVWCNPSAVAVRLCSGIAGAKFALLSGRSATGRTMDGKCLFGSEFFFHDRKIMAQTDLQEWSVLIGFRGSQKDQRAVLYESRAATCA